MTKSNSSDIYKISSWAAFILLGLFSLIWMAKSYQYSSIKFLEEIQLFRTDLDYFGGYISEPAGLISYLSSFFTQFYFIPLTGIIILTVCILIVYILILYICKKEGNIFKYFLLPLITPIFLVFIYNAENAMHIGLASYMGIIISLAAFLVYLNLGKKIQYFVGIILYLLVYFIAGGNALLFVGLVLIKELFKTNKAYWFFLALVALALLFPYLSYQFIYITSLQKAYFSFTPIGLIHFNLFYNLAWFSIPVIYIIWMAISRKPSATNSKSKSIIICCSYFVIAGLICGWGISKYEKHEMEYIMHMAYETEQGNWDKVIEMGNKAWFTNAVPIAYFMNIAHFEKGTLVSDIFKYRQTGTYGLFVSWAIHHTTDLYIGELYYRAGFAAIAEQCAFEALVTSPYEHSSKALRRIVQTNMQRKDREGFEKYIRIFEKSPVYKKWAKEQREQFQLAMNDSNYIIPGLPEVAHYENFFFSSGKQEHNFLALLTYDPQNKKAFEYFTAFLLLKKDLLSFNECMDIYYNNFNYPELPRAFEEALLILAYNDRPELIEKYGISQNTINRFATMNSDLKRAGSQKAQQAVNEKYKDTYWSYYKYTKPMMLEEIPGMMVY